MLIVFSITNVNNSIQILALDKSLASSVKNTNKAAIVLNNASRLYMIFQPKSRYLL